MMPIKWSFILIFIFLLTGCQPKKQDAADVGLSNASASNLVGPALTSRDIEVKHAGIIFVDLTASNDDLTFSYTITQFPTNGVLLGTPPYVIYAAGPGYVGLDRFYFNAVNSRGDWARATVGVTVLPDSKVVYLRTTGDDLTGVSNNSSKPFRTANKAVQAALDLVPSKTNPVVINVGAGTTYGSVTLTGDLGSYVTWEADSSVSPIIGNISGTGTDGASNQDGMRGWEIFLSATSNITFGNITSQGGLAGTAVTKNTYGGRPGQITIKAKVGNIFSIPGSGQRKSDGTCIGQNAGQVLIEKDFVASSITANGYTCNDAGDGGNIIVYGQVSGNIEAIGGADYVSGHGGNVAIFGKVIGNVNIYGGAQETAGNGGYASVSGTIYGDINAFGGSGVLGGRGGSVDVQPGAVLRDISVNGGSGTLDGGLGGLVRVTGSTVRNINANGGDSASTDPYVLGDTDVGGRGGEVSLHGNAFAQSITVTGGACNNSRGGDGGRITLHVTAIFDYGTSSIDGGVCSPGLVDGTVGSFTSM